MTANVLPAQVSRFMQAGMNDHVGKPFKRDELLAAIRHWGDGRRHGGTLARDAPPAQSESFDSGTYSEIISLVDEKRRPALLDKLSALLAAWPGPAEAEAMDRDQLAAKAHQLVSAAGILGFQELSELCRELEMTCCIEPPGPDLLTDVNTARLNAFDSYYGSQASWVSRASALDVPAERRACFRQRAERTSGTVPIGGDGGALALRDHARADVRAMAWSGQVSGAGGRLYPAPVRNAAGLAADPESGRDSLGRLGARPGSAG